MPDGSKGYSLIVFITAEDFQPIPIGMACVLRGIGGMVAINRTFDEEAMRAGLRNKTLGTLLFPQGPDSQRARDHSQPDHDVPGRGRLLTCSAC